METAEKNRVGISKKISKKEWVEFFRASYEGRDQKTENWENLESEGPRITKEEVVEAIRKVKKKKAAGEDGIKGEAWLEAGEKVVDILVEKFNEISKGGEVPEGWKVGQVVPVYKKGDVDEVKNYRGVTLMDVDYKIYAEILRKKLEDEVEGKELIQETQMGFRKKRDQ